MIKSIVPAVLWFYFWGQKYDGSNKLNAIPVNRSEVIYFFATNLVDFLEDDVCIYYSEYQQKRFRSRLDGSSSWRGVGSNRSEAVRTTDVRFLTTGRLKNIPPLWRNLTPEILIHFEKRKSAQSTRLFLLWNLTTWYTELFHYNVMTVWQYSTPWCLASSRPWFTHPIRILKLTERLDIETIMTGYIFNMF